MSATEGVNEVCTLRIELCDSDPLIWRQVRLRQGVPSPRQRRRVATTRIVAVGDDRARNRGALAGVDHRSQEM